MVHRYLATYLSVTNHVDSSSIQLERFVVDRLSDPGLLYKTFGKRLAEGVSSSSKRHPKKGANVAFARLSRHTMVEHAIDRLELR